MHYNGFPAAEINGGPAPGFSSGQAQAGDRRACSHDRLPSSMSFEWTELAYQETLTGNTMMLVFPLCVLLVYVVLAAQYESWTLPLSVILIVPMTLLCAITGVWLTGGDNNVFTQISFLVLAGLACKNAILIVEFARQREQEGRGPPAGDPRRLPRAAAAGADDVGRVHHGRRAAGVLDRRRRRDPARDGRRRVRRHARRHRVRPVPDAGLLRVRQPAGRTLLEPPRRRAVPCRPRRWWRDNDRNISKRRRSSPRSRSPAGCGARVAVSSAGDAAGRCEARRSRAVRPTSPTIPAGGGSSTIRSSKRSRIEALRANLDVRMAVARVSQARAVFDETAARSLSEGDRRRQRRSARAGHSRASPTSRSGPRPTAPASTRSGRSICSAGSGRRCAPRRPTAASFAATLDDVRVSVAAEVARNYFELRGLQQQLAVAERSLANQQETLRLTRVRRDAGIGEEQDVASAAARVAAIEASFPPLRTAIAARRHRLAVLAGQRPGELAVDLASRAYPPIAKALPLGDPAMLLQRRPDVRAAERRRPPRRRARASPPPTSFRASASRASSASWPAAAACSAAPTRAPGR